MYRIQSSSKKHLINLSYLGVKLKITPAITLEGSSEVDVPQYFKPKIKSFTALRKIFSIFLDTLMFYVQFLLLPVKFYQKGVEMEMILVL